MRFKLLLFTLLCSLAAIMPAKAETLTVYDQGGTTNNANVPIYGLWADAYLKCEFVIPASKLDNMKNGTITGLTWYFYSKPSKAWSGTFQIFIKEVNETSISAYSGTTGATTVYEGSLDGTKDPFKIEFTNPYSYGGGNLLVGIYQTNPGAYASANFLGETVSGASVQGYYSSSLSGVSANQRNFIPMTTFTYEPASAYPKPTNLAVSDITAHSANASWTGNDDAQSYNLRYRPLSTLSWDFEDQGQFDEWTKVDADGDGFNWSYETAGYTTHSGSGLVVSASYDNDTGTALTPNNWLISPQVTLGGVLKLWAAGQDSNGYHNEVFGVYVCTGDPSNMNNFVQVGADVTTAHEFNEYEYDLSAFNGTGYIAIVHHNITDQFVLNVDDISYSLAGDWITVNGVTSPYTINGLNPQTIYEVQVQAVYSDDSSDWTNSVEFTTQSATALPTDLTVTDVTSYTAKTTWNGVQDNFNLRYRKLSFLENFDNGLPSTWTTIDADGDGYNWSAANYGNGTICVTSESYHNNETGSGGVALTPENWLITPKVTLGNLLTLDAWGQDVGYFAEVFKVYVSTTGTAVADFIEISGDITTTHNQTVYEFNLGQYAGQEGYIAICHYNCTDMFHLNIDNLGIGDNWTTVNNVTSPKTITNLVSESNYEVQVQGIVDNETTTGWTLPVYFTTLEAQAEEATLAEICASGQDGLNKVFTVSDDLIAVDYRVVAGEGVYLWCKDLNNSIVKTQIKNGQIDFMKQQGAQVDEWDQSNWVILKLPNQTGLIKAMETVPEISGKRQPHYIIPGTVTGTFVDDMNYMLEVTDLNFEVGETAPFTPNVYCATNFIPAYTSPNSDGAQTIGDPDTYYFFMNPKANEICIITWAKWASSDDGPGYFTVPQSSGFNGAFNVDWSYNEDGDTSKDLEDDDTMYEFTAVIQRNTYEYGVTRAAQPSDDITVMAMNLSAESAIDPATAISTILAGNGEVIGVEYVNSLGVVSKTPFQGVNIIVTRYSDGSTTTVKKVFR